MDNLCYFILLSFLLASVYCSVENSTNTDNILENSFIPGDGIQVQNLFVASCENIKEDLNSVKTSIADQNNQMQCVKSSIEDVFNIANETKENVIKQNNLVENLVDSVESFNSKLVAQNKQSKNIVKSLETQGNQLQTLTTLMTEFVSKKKEESAITVMSCPEDFQEFQGKCYKFYGHKKNPINASEFCKQDEGFLAEPKNELENDFLSDLGNRSGVLTIWLGGTDMSKEGEWRWVSNNDLISGYTNWYDGEWEDMSNQPRDHFGNEDCLLAWSRHNIDLFGRWWAYDCRTKHSFVCQTAMVPSVKQSTKA